MYGGANRRLNKEMGLKIMAAVVAADPSEEGIIKNARSQQHQKRKKRRLAMRPFFYIESCWSCITGPGRQRVKRGPPSV